MKKSADLSALLACILLLLLLALNTGLPQRARLALSSRPGFRLYQFRNIPLSLQLPDSTRVSEDDYHSEEVLFSSFLLDEKWNFRGYLQVWKIADLKSFLNNARSHSTFAYSRFSLEKTESPPGYRTDWTATMSRGIQVSGREYFIKTKDAGRVIRISLFTDRPEFPAELASVMEIMINSLTGN